MTFNLDEYVDVAERIRVFKEKHPDGSLQSTIEWESEPHGWMCTAYAYRTPDDPRPGVGHAFEPVPGKTTFTKDSEAMNAQTSAWGRAIVALGFETKKIASANEVMARKPSEGDPSPGHSVKVNAPTNEEIVRSQFKSPTPLTGTITEPQRKKIAAVINKLARANRITPQQVGTFCDEALPTDVTMDVVTPLIAALSKARASELIGKLENLENVPA